MEGHLTQHISSEHPRVMVVDGSRVVRKLIEQLLRADLPGVVVLACETGAEAKQQLETGVVDLITTALRLPDMDGLELAELVHARWPRIRLLLTSGHHQVPDSSLPDDGKFVGKPWTDGTLVAKVRAVLKA